MKHGQVLTLTRDWREVLQSLRASFLDNHFVTRCSSSKMTMTAVHKIFLSTPSLVEVQPGLKNRSHLKLEGVGKVSTQLKNDKSVSRQPFKLSCPLTIFPLINSNPTFSKPEVRPETFSFGDQSNFSVVIFGRKRNNGGRRFRKKMGPLESSRSLLLPATERAADAAIRFVLRLHSFT